MTIKLDSKNIDRVRSTLKKEKVFTLKQLISLLECSRRTAQIQLSRWKTYTSYNKNSMYYTFPGIPKFDVHGLWRYEDVAFSKFGNLKSTIVNLVNSSESGLTGKELGDLLGLAPRNFVHQFRDCPGIYREKHGGVYIHFSEKRGKYKQQMRKRIATLLPAVKNTISGGEAIIILVAIIKDHGISIKEILELPEIHTSGVPEAAVRNFMQFHGLLKKIPVTQP